MRLSRKRHLAKTITWRAIASIDTFLLSWILTGNIVFGLKISSFEIFSKMILYYLHERAWYKSSFKTPHTRHILKTFSWRFLGTIDTIVISWIVTGLILSGFKIGIAEVITKMILYYLHEKLWYKLNYGLIGKIKRKLR